MHSGVVRGVAERMLQLVPEGRCLPAKADLRLFRGRRGGEAEHCRLLGGGSFHFVCYYFLRGRGGLLENECNNSSRKLVLSLRLLHSGRILETSSTEGLQVTADDKLGPGSPKLCRGRAAGVGLVPLKSPFRNLTRVQ